VPLLAIMKLVFEAVPQWQPFAYLMGDDTDLRSVSRKAFRRVASRVNPKKTGTR
jgi:hypothetical protein